MADNITPTEPTEPTDGFPSNPEDAPTHEDSVEALLSAILFAVTEQNTMLREAVTVLNAVGEKAEGFLGGKDGKPAGPGAMLSKLLLG